MDNLTPKQKEKVKQEAHKIGVYRKHIRLFLKDIWGLTPQKLKPEYREQWNDVMMTSFDNWDEASKRVKAEWFGDYDTEKGVWVWYDFQKGKHITWQQTLILIGIEKAVAGDAVRKISVASGRGIGKSASCSWIILWFLYCYYDAQVPCTAPTAHQMHDVLWKELNLWINKMPSGVKELYEWQKGYIRINYSPNTWFARARTSSKENTEAIAGVHADHMLIVCDEASGIERQVFTTAMGALTSGNVLFIMISNPRRTTGYFYDSHHRNYTDFQTFVFNGEESPVVDKEFMLDMEKQHGTDSTEYGIEVRGKFPDEDSMDDSGYIQLFNRNKITVRSKEEMDIPFMGGKVLGVDPSGEGKDIATFVLRDRFKAECIKKLQTTNSREIAEYILTFIDRYSLDPKNVVCGSFGVGTDVGKEVALASQGRYNIYTVLEGNSPALEEDYNYEFFDRRPEELQNPDTGTGEYIDLFLNMRALMYFRTRKWLETGGHIIDNSVDNSPFLNELLNIRYKRSLQGNKIQLMSKKEMLKLRIKSPNIADGLALSMLREIEEGSSHDALRGDLADHALGEIMTDGEKFSCL